jgi:carotenoid cleavage dioxygenase-like enzyme
VLAGRASVGNHPAIVRRHALSPHRGRFIACALVDELVANVGPAADKWNAEVLEQWEHAWVTGSEGDYEIDDIEGTIPRSLSGAIFRNGPGNFERGGQRFQHVLDGDGLLCRFSIDGERGRAHFRARFVRTPEFEAERKADAVLFRNTFGTQPAGLLANVGKLSIKNVANTNVQAWGGRTYALWEAGLPVRVDPRTLDFEGYETFGGAIAGGVASVVTGVERLDRLLGYGEAFTAHPRHDMRRGTVVGWTWAIKPTLDGQLLKIFEFGHEDGEVRSVTKASLPTPLAPHDFIVTDSWSAACPKQKGCGHCDDMITAEMQYKAPGRAVGYACGVACALGPSHTLHQH